jgi:predicted ArsR family transcriptional regulator
MDGWWDDIEEEIRAYCEQQGSVTMKDLARQLAMSPAATASILRVLGITGEMRLTPSSLSWHGRERDRSHE